MRVWIGFGIFLGVLIIAFVIFALRTSEGPSAVPVPAPTEASITGITVAHSYRSKTGLHTISGTATVPTACTSMTATSSLETTGSSTAAVIRIDLAAPIDTGACLELPTSVLYSVSVAAPSEASVAIYANGTLATTTP